MEEKKTVGRVVNIEHSDNLALMQYKLDLKKKGVRLTSQEVVDRIFQVGLYSQIKDLKNENY